MLGAKEEEGEKGETSFGELRAISLSLRASPPSFHGLVGGGGGNVIIMKGLSDKEGLGKRN